MLGVLQGDWIDLTVMKGIRLALRVIDRTPYHARVRAATIRGGELRGLIRAGSYRHSLTWVFCPAAISHRPPSLAIT